MSDRLRGLLKGAVGPADNDSRFLLDVHSRELPGEDTMRRYPPGEEVDLVIVGAGAGGSVLAQRLARHGWKIVIVASPVRVSCASGHEVRPALAMDAPLPDTWDCCGFPAGSHFDAPPDAPRTEPHKTRTCRQSAADPRLLA